MINLKMGLVSLDQQSNHGIMDEENQGSSSYSCSEEEEEEVSSNFSNSSDSEMFGEEEEEGGEGEEGDSSESSNSTSPNSKTGALQNMSTLLQELPFKRGLSKHYNGKSQSFTSLSNVRSLEDMAKPENPYNKKLKSCKSYGVFLEGFNKSDYVIRSNSSSRVSSKRGSCSSLRTRRNGSFLGNNNSSRPPIPPHISSSTTSFTSSATPLFA